MRSVLRYVLAIPLGIIGSSIMQFIWTFFISVVYSYFMSNFLDFEDWIPKFFSGLIFPIIVAMIIPSKHKIFAIICLLLTLIAFIYNVYKFDIYHIAHLIGGILGSSYVFATDGNWGRAD